MNISMQQWLSSLSGVSRKKPLPILSFPSIQLMGCTVRELISDSHRQAQGMQLIADRLPTAAAVSLMDLSVEAECFGTPIRVADDEVPTCTAPVISVDADEEERMVQAEALAVPQIGTGRTGLYIDAIREALTLISDRPVLAGVIGPFSLAGRLVSVTESMLYCYDEPEMMHTVLEKAASFITDYILAYKAVGAHGVVMAEPLAGLLSPALAQEFSGDYCKRIVDAVKGPDFVVIYHNCGNTAALTLPSILGCGADAYHFGNAVDMAEILSKVPEDTLCMGNISPAEQFRGGTPESVRVATLELMERCCRYPNFVLSSGCDIPPLSPWGNIDAFFRAAEEFYTR